MSKLADFDHGFSKTADWNLVDQCTFACFYSLL